MGRRDGECMVRLVRRCIVLVRGLEERSGDVDVDWRNGGWVTWMNLESEKAMVEENA